MSSIQDYGCPQSGPGPTLGMMWCLCIALAWSFIMPADGEASFWLKCEYKATVTAIEVIEKETGSPEILATLEVIKAWKRGGHIQAKDCDMKPGQNTEISTLPNDEDQRQKRDFNRSITRIFDPGRYDIYDIRPADIVRIQYEFYNERTGDSHSWRLLRHRPVDRDR